MLLTASSGARRRVAFETALLAARHTGVKEEIIANMEATFLSGEPNAGLVESIKSHQQPLHEIAGPIELRLEEGNEVADQEIRTLDKLDRLIVAYEAMLEALNPDLLEAACGALFQAQFALEIPEGQYGPLKSLVEQAIRDSG